MSYQNIVHIPAQWDKVVSLIWHIFMPMFLMSLSFLVVFFPIQVFFLGYLVPDFPVMILFCLFFHRFSLYFIPIFFVFTTYFEYLYGVPLGGYLSLYAVFSLLTYILWGYNPATNISFRLIYFYFAVIYFVSLVFYFFNTLFLFKSFIGVTELLSLWFNGLIVFPAVFHIFFYFCLNHKKIVEQDDL